ncbi:DUF5763 domain-containing protein [Chlorobaculum thiosulfatiphilum]|uniref:DUF5763 domain-containing protein n=1 Tax=Chlorobaculum thiosulfatiphilum TaxID=115852 RepID=UPI001FE9F757|nr:DUF5763 domain-containing protein [Chlorobaculum thiosulfatiphilum]
MATQVHENSINHDVNIITVPNVQCCSAVVRLRSMLDTYHAEYVNHNKMQCQGFTKSGNPCRNQASANGFCHIHGGTPTRKARRREAEHLYNNMTPEQKAENDSYVMGCMLVIIAFAILYGLITGDWQGVGKWLSR